MPRHLSRWLGPAIRYIVLMAGATLVMIPFIWMVSSSLKAPGRVLTYPPEWIPDPLNWQNYTELFTLAPFGRYILNTGIITVLNITGQLLSSSLVAFGFARMRFPGRDVLFVLMISTLLLPAEVTIVPQFMLFTELGWRDTFLPLIVPAFFGGPVYIFLLRQFFRTIPGELADAARLDGANSFRIYWQIWLPLSRPALATVAIFTFLASWNEYLGPLIYLTSQEKYTISIGLAAFRGFYDAQWHYIMAGTVLSVIPCILVFIVAQRYFVQGIVLTGMQR